MKMRFGWALVLILGLAPATWSQSAGGNVYGKVADEQGAVLPGASVQIGSSTIGGAPRTATTGAQGDFRFLNLDPGRYVVTVAMKGFATTTRAVAINTGTNVDLTFGLKVAGISETLSVTAETPTVDTKRVGTSTTLTSDELSKTPQGRDPWAVLKTVPGVLVDRVSIAGNEAGQQSNFAGKGAQFTDTMWNLDGVVITDTTSYGASSMYFDFDAFDQINVTTGGGDLKVQTGGLGLNFVTKRGTNAFHGSARIYGSSHKAESKNVPSAIAGSATLLDGRADQIRQIADYGFDLGGPLIKDKLWFWGSYGHNDIRLYRYTSASADKTILNNFNAKVNWQASPNDMVSFFFFNGKKSKFGRDPGYEANNAALWNQGSFYEQSSCGLPCGMHGLWKAEVNHTFSSNLFVNAKYAFFNWGYGFDAQDGGSNDLSIDHVAGTAKGSAEKLRFLKPWHTANVDGSYFFNGLGGSNELKFGFGYRHWPNTSSAAFSGNEIVSVHNNDDPTDPASHVAWVTRPGVVKFVANNLSAYVGDTLTSGRMTLNAGVRWDRQEAKNSPSTAPANALFPDLLPALNFDGNTPAIVWKDFSPRVGLTVALDDKKKTVVRASYARYAGQLGPLDASYNSPVTYGYTYLAYRWADRNGDGFAQKDEILTNAGVLYFANVDPKNPTSLGALNKIDPNYHANHDQEAIVGIDHELLPNFSVGAAYTWRRGTDIADWAPRIDSSGRLLTSADYIPATVTGGGFSATYYSPDPAKVGDGARLLTNRTDMHLAYSGLEFTVNKRLSNRWMFRGAASWMDWKYGIDGPAALQNPTITDRDSVSTGGGPSGQSGPATDGGIVSLRSYGAKTNTYINSKWQVSANGLYQLPGDFDVAAALTGRQGYPRALYLQQSAGLDGALRVLVQPEDAQRYPNFWNLDLRLAKTLKIKGSSNINVALDLFNVFNNNAVLQLGPRQNSAAANQILEVVNPRILRLGLRLQF